MQSPVRRIVSTLVGCAVATALYMGGRTNAAWVAGGIAIAVSAISFASPRAARAIERALGLFAAWVGKILTFVLVTWSFVFVVVPASLLLRLFGRRHFALRGDPRCVTYWEPIPSSAGLYARTYLRDWERQAQVSHVSRLTMALAGLGLLTAVGALNAYWGMYLRRTEDRRAVGASIAMERVKPAWEAGLPWLPTYIHEERESADRRYVPFVGWRHLDFDGWCVGIDNGLRRTIPAGPDDAPIVAMFGGSALWGVGARNEHTIASELAALLKDRGRAARVVNYSEPGYTLWQDTLVFQEEIARGRRPKVALFYDGINELLVQVSDGPATEPTHFGSKRLQSQLHDRNFSLTASLRANNGIAIFLRELRTPVDVPANYDLPKPTAEYVVPAARDYRGALDIAEGVAKQFGIGVKFFWQPALCTRVPAVAGEALVRAQLTHLDRQCPAYDQLTKAVDAPPLVRLDAVFDGRPEPFYLDYVHVNEAANRLVAEAMLPHVLAALDAP